MSIESHSDPKQLWSGIESIARREVVQQTDLSEIEKQTVAHYLGKIFDSLALNEFNNEKAKPVDARDLGHVVDYMHDDVTAEIDAMDAKLNAALETLEQMPPHVAEVVQNALEKAKKSVVDRRDRKVERVFSEKILQEAMGKEEYGDPAKRADFLRAARSQPEIRQRILEATRNAKMGENLAMLSKLSEFYQIPALDNATDARKAPVQFDIMQQELMTLCDTPECKLEVIVAKVKELVTQTADETNAVIDHAEQGFQKRMANTIIASVLGRSSFSHDDRIRAFEQLLGDGVADADSKLKLRYQSIGDLKAAIRGRYFVMARKPIPGSKSIAETVEKEMARQYFDAQVQDLENHMTKTASMSLENFTPKGDVFDLETRQLLTPTQELQNVIKTRLYFAKIAIQHLSNRVGNSGRRLAGIDQVMVEQKRNKLFLDMIAISQKSILSDPDKSKELNSARKNITDTLLQQQVDAFLEKPLIASIDDLVAQGKWTEAMTAALQIKHSPEASAWIYQGIETALSAKLAHNSLADNEISVLTQVMGDLKHATPPALASRQQDLENQQERAVKIAALGKALDIAEGIINSETVKAKIDSELAYREEVSAGKGINMDTWTIVMAALQRNVQTAVDVGFLDPPTAFATYQEMLNLTQTVLIRHGYSDTRAEGPLNQADQIMQSMHKIRIAEEARDAKEARDKISYVVKFDEGLRGNDWRKKRRPEVEKEVANRRAAEYQAKNISSVRNAIRDKQWKNIDLLVGLIDTDLIQRQLWREIYPAILSDFNSGNTDANLLEIGCKAEYALHYSGDAAVLNKFKREQVAAERKAQEDARQAEKQRQLELIEKQRADEELAKQKAAEEELKNITDLISSGQWSGVLGAIRRLKSNPEQQRQFFQKLLALATTEQSKGESANADLIHVGMAAATELELYTQEYHLNALSKKLAENKYQQEQQTHYMKDLAPGFNIESDGVTADMVSQKLSERLGNLPLALKDAAGMEGYVKQVGAVIELIRRAGDVKLLDDATAKKLSEELLQKIGKVIMNMETDNTENPISTLSISAKQIMKRYSIPEDQFPIERWDTYRGRESLRTFAREEDEIAALQIQVDTGNTDWRDIRDEIEKLGYQHSKSEPLIKLMLSLEAIVYQMVENGQEPTDELMEAATSLVNMPRHNELFALRMEMMKKKMEANSRRAILNRFAATISVEVKDPIDPSSLTKGIREYISIVYQRIAEDWRNKRIDVQRFVSDCTWLVKDVSDAAQVGVFAKGQMDELLNPIRRALNELSSDESQAGAIQKILSSMDGAGSPN